MNPNNDMMLYASTERINFSSTDGIHIIYAFLHTPNKGKIKGIVQISHGMCEYKKRYDNFADYLCSLGYAVCIHDHLGHGESVFNKEELGFFAHKNGVDFLVQDLFALTLILKKQFPSLPLFLLGHSMGSFVARAYLAKHSHALAGAILMGTAGKNPLCKAGINLSRHISKKHSPHYRSKTLAGLAFFAYNRKVDPLRTSFDWLSRDEAVVDAYIKDPYCNFTFTASGFFDLSSLLLLANDEGTFHIKKDLPLLLMAGDKDPVGSYSKGPRDVCLQYQKHGCTAAALKLYSDARHELLNETNRTEVYSDIADFLNAIVPPLTQESQGTM